MSHKRETPPPGFPAHVNRDGSGVWIVDGKQVQWPAPVPAPPAAEGAGGTTPREYRVEMFEAFALFNAGDHRAGCAKALAAFDGLRESLTNENGELESAVDALENAVEVRDLRLQDVSFALESLVDTDLAHDDPECAARLVAEMVSEQRAEIDRLRSVRPVEGEDADRVPNCWRCKTRPGVVNDGTTRECVECAGQTAKRTRQMLSEIDAAVREGLPLWPRIMDRVEFVRECIKLHREQAARAPLSARPTPETDR